MRSRFLDHLTDHRERRRRLQMHVGPVQAQNLLTTCCRQERELHRVGQMQALSEETGSRRAGRVCNLAG